MVLNNLNLTVSPGEIIGISGPSGCGKSTLLRLIAGLDKPDQGEIYLNGQLISNSSWALAPNKRQMGMVFQSMALWPHLTVYQHLEYGLKTHDRNEKDALIQEMLKRLQIQSLAKRRPHQLSGGERQRIALGRTLIIKPTVILCDEPFSSLDISLVKEIRDLFYQTVREEGMTSIFVSHDPLDLEEADRVVVMNK
jgi:ABC-type Fe3+/spermidine/putrescine transport system ATPase subunit